MNVFFSHGQRISFILCVGCINLCILRLAGAHPLLGVEYVKEWNEAKRGQLYYRISATEYSCGVNFYGVYMIYQDRWEKKAKRNSKWHKWFAWYPVKLAGFDEKAWLSYVERRWVFVPRMIGHFNEYRKIK